MRKTSTLLIQKADGRLEPFSAYKLRACVCNVLRNGGLDDQLAEPLARAVELHLAESGGRKPPPTEFIYRCVGAVLAQTGLPEAAERLAAHREARAARRGRVRVFDVAAQGDAPSSLWDKGRLARSLETRHGLQHAVARFLAGQIETRVFALNYRCLSNALVEALVHNELSEWGLSSETRPAPHPPDATPLAGSSAKKEN